MYKMAIIGDEDSILGFRAVGVDTFPITEEKDISQLINRLAQDEYAIIFVTEQTARVAWDTISKYNSVPFPAIITVPNNIGTTGMGMNALKTNAERAIGMNILFK